MEPARSVLAGRMAPYLAAELGSTPDQMVPPRSPAGFMIGAAACKPELSPLMMLKLVRDAFAPPTLPLAKICSAFFYACYIYTYPGQQANV